jgi:hypothetical protein
MVLVLRIVFDDAYMIHTVMLLKRKSRLVVNE